ncbi:hypothetical protein SLEP1_g55409 [Rubroshorea leprosula]|uniref:Uncharacterized protein n=1 Tax=Rubroshorea leprosula TaxID=152421 RepID=A0AAV5MJH6_9ROSI|nr:hypothetical protein SLEP1_g55409 [Rubroshorea leprosula]
MTHILQFHFYYGGQMAIELPILSPKLDGKLMIYYKEVRSQNTGYKSLKCTQHRLALSWDNNTDRATINVK